MRQQDAVDWIAGQALGDTYPLWYPLLSTIAHATNSLGQAGKRDVCGREPGEQARARGLRHVLLLPGGRLSGARFGDPLRRDLATSPGKLRVRMV